MPSAAQFETALLAKRDQVIAQVVELHRTIALDAFRMLAADSVQAGYKYGSPIWSGRYRSNHNISIGNPDMTVKPANPDTVGKGATRWPDSPLKVLNAQPLTNAASMLARLQPFDVVYITNPLPYARPLEEGWSKFKAPEGIYEVTAQALNTKYGNVTLKGTK